jgi:hypothetical protein
MQFNTFLFLLILELTNQTLKILHTLQIEFQANAKCNSNCLQKVLPLQVQFWVQQLSQDEIFSTCEAQT